MVFMRPDLWQVVSKECSMNGSIPFTAAGPLLSCLAARKGWQLEAGQFHKHDVGRGGRAAGAPRIGCLVLCVLASDAVLTFGCTCQREEQQ